MAIYDLGTASLAANGAVTGVGTKWKAPLTLIRVGATIVFKTEPVQIYTISEIISDTRINVYNPNSETAPTGTGYAILAHDDISVQGFAQAVAETLRYYKSSECRISQAVGAFNNFDANDFNSKVTQVNTQHGDVVSIGAQVVSDANQVSLDKDSTALNNMSASNAAACASAAKNAAATSATNAKASETNAKASETSANGSKNAAATSANNAKTSETNSKASETAALASKNAAAASQTAAAGSATAALASQNAAKTSETNAKEYADSINQGLFLAKDKNLQDIPDKTAARSNLQLSKADNVEFGSVSTTGRVSCNGVLLISDGYTNMTMASRGSNVVGSRRVFEISPTGGFYFATRNLDNNTGQYIINFPTSGGTLALQGTSDINYKTDISNYDGLQSVSNIKKMELVTFKFKDDEKKRERRGVIAQQIEKIDPQYVKHTLEPSGDDIFNDDGVKIGSSEFRERLVLDQNAILLDAICALKVTINESEEAKKRIENLEFEVGELKLLIKGLIDNK